MAEKKEKKKGRLKAFLKILLIASLVGVTVLIYGYFAFEYNRLKGFSFNPVQDWRSYISFLMSKIPFVNRYVKYEPLQILTAQEYFQEISRSAALRAQQILDEARKTMVQAQDQLKVVEAERQTVLKMRKEWEDKMLQVEAALKRLQSPDDIKKISETISNADPAAIAPVLASDEYSVDSIAAALVYLSSDLRADLLTELGKVNTAKAAQVMNKIASVENIIGDLREKEKQLDQRQKQLTNELSSLIDAGLIRELSVQSLKEFTNDEILQMIDSLSLDENSVMVMLSFLDSERSKEILKQIKEQKPLLFQKLVLKGVSL
ncbi:hypothetical protein ACSFC1_02995 [Pseudothermotoga sp. U03pept]|uniref:hypothetical protein n=1 Tax=Pseudothermotoga sp. U03pept TaxID=3447012 RepID=UPI003EFF2896